MSATAIDRHWMAQALSLGAIAEGTTSPNPRVGCLLVRDGRLVGRGYHRAPGQPHAEILALREAGSAARGATMYVSLEPCAHHGRTPPCVAELMRSGVRRVVAAMQDPDPRVDGRGFAELRQGKVAVEVGVLGEESRRLNEPFVRWHKQRLPLVTLKAAISLDGMLSADHGVSQWITGPTARRFTHRLRLRHDALLVGAGTVRRDNPRLTVRLPGIRAPRRRVVLSTSLELDPASNVFALDQPDSPRTRVYTSAANTMQPEPLLERGEVIRVAEGEGGADLSAVLADLALCGVQSVLIEGGGRTFARFLEAGLAQRMALFISGKLLGSRGGAPLIDRATVARPELGWRFEREELIPLGEDLLLWGRLLGSGDRPGRGGNTCSPD